MKLIYKKLQPVTRFAETPDLLQNVTLCYKMLQKICYNANK